MKVAVVRFPGANCEQDAFHALSDDLGVKASYVWHEETNLSGYDAVFLPGGFTYGDYLRVGAIASRAPVMREVMRMAHEGYPIIGACNGFQILCEAGILPGALLQNEGHKFVCKTVAITAVSKKSMWTKGVQGTLHIPIAHAGGCYFCDNEVLAALHDNDQIAFKYAAGHNANGSIDDIAGITNVRGNVIGLMPHPERATRESLGSADGLQILRALTLVSV